LAFSKEWKVIKKLIRCATCNQVIPDYSGYELARAQSLLGVEWSNADLAGAKKFLRTHFGHPLEELVVEEDEGLNGVGPSYPLDFKSISSQK